MIDRKQQTGSDYGAKANRDQPALGGPYYEICLKGHLNSDWKDWLQGLDVKPLENGETVLSGIIVDQAALMGLLDKLIRLNLTLLSVNEIRLTGSKNQ